MNLFTFNFKSYKRIIITFLLLLLLFLLLIAVFVRVMNPHNVWQEIYSGGVNANKPPAFFSQLAIKPVMMLHRDPDILVVGTSRAALGYSNRDGAQDYFNAAMAGSAMHSNKMWINYMDAFSDFSEVILFLDFFSFNEYGNFRYNDLYPYDVSRASENRIPLYLTSKRVGLWASYFYSTGLVDSVKMLQNKNNDKGFYLNYDGSFEYPDYIDKKLWKRAITSHVKDILFPNDKFCLYAESGSSVNYEALVSILEDMHKKNISVTLVVSPLHYYIRSIMDEVGLTSSFYDWKKKLVYINQLAANNTDREPFLIWDFSSINRYSSTKKESGWYYDPSHMSKKYGESISHFIKGGDGQEWLINRANMDEKLRNDQKLLLAEKLRHKNDSFDAWLKSYAERVKGRLQVCNLKENNIEAP